MKDLSKTSGLEIKIDNNKLNYDESVFESEPKARTYEEAKDVYLEKGASDQDLYYMYRYFEATKDADTFEDHKAEYDITVINPGKIGPEAIKTVGHYHALVPGTEISYPEVYEVIEGEITYLFQTLPNENHEVDVIIVEAKKGDKVVVPPNFGHVSINRGQTIAISSNIQRRDLPAGANYDAFKERNGAALYLTGDGWVENYNYTIRTQKNLKPHLKPEWGIGNEPLYTAFVKNPEKFEWLTEPQEFDFKEFLEEN